MADIKGGQSPMAKAVHCLCGLPVAHRISRKSYSYGRPFSSCPIHSENANYCGFFRWDDLPYDEPKAQAPVEQHQITAEYTLDMDPPTASTSPCHVKRPAASSTEDVLQVPSSSPKRARNGPDSPSREYGRPSPPPLKNSATAQSEFRPVRPVIPEEVIQDILDALPAIPIYVRELKRQISSLQESNEMSQRRILKLEKQLWENEKWRGFD